LAVDALCCPGDRGGGESDEEEDVDGDDGEFSVFSTLSAGSELGTSLRQLPGSITDTHMDRQI
jgi:hypothetical protein